MTIETKNWLHLFPLEKPRAQQEEAINFILNSYANGKKIVVAELGTGVGKSCVGITVSRFLNQNTKSIPFSAERSGTWFLTSQKILQDQYIKDFGKPKGDLVSLKSSSNYKCEYYKELNCQEANALLKRETNPQDPFLQHCWSKCIYKQAKNDFFINNKFGITNFLFFLTGRRLFSQRKLLVVDECHYVEDILSNFVEVSISENFCQKYLNLEFPKFSTPEKEIFWWMTTELFDAVCEKKKYYDDLMKKMDQTSKNHALVRISDIVKDFEKVSGVEYKLRQFSKIYRKEIWVMNLIEAVGNKSKRIEFKPTDISKYTLPNLFQYGEYVLMMSATILNFDIYREALGIPKDKCAFISLESPFPVKNKPIFYLSSGKMAKSKIEQSLPVVVENIKNIIDMHNKDKGIIHTNTYQIANYIKENLKNKRFIFHDEKDRDKALEFHLKSKKPTILVSPSMGEGVDLKDDLSRFQIVCKLPYPFLGDRIVLKKMEQNEKWYDFMTAKALIQMVGRSIRNENDFAATYILDGCWEDFYKRASYLFPKSFKDSLNA